MVGVAIGFASTTAFPAVERLSKNGKGRTNNVVVRGMRFAKLGQTKPSGPTGLGIRGPLLRKEAGERKSYAIDRPLFLILFEAGPIETEMLKRNRGRVLPLESKPFEAPVVIAVATPTLSFVLIAPDFDLYDLRAVQSQPFP